MQIREKGKKILLIKTEYIPEKKRTVGKTVASINSSLSTVPEDVRQQLDEIDCRQLEKWFVSRAENRKYDIVKNSLSSLIHSAEILTNPQNSHYVDRAYNDLLSDLEMAADMGDDRENQITASLSSALKDFKKRLKNGLSSEIQTSLPLEPTNIK